jgi:hypothetical protein
LAGAHHRTSVNGVPTVETMRIVVLAVT